MKKLTLVRVFAYILDIIFVSVIVSLFAKIEFINPTYDKYLEVNEQYKEIYSDYMEKVSNDKTELNQIEDQLYDLQYYSTKYSVPSSIISVVLTALYFIVFQYFNQGQTLGKRLLKLKIVSNDREDVSLMQILGRSLIINSIITSTISIALISFLSKANYLKYAGYVTYLDFLLIFICLGFMAFRADGRGLHDMFANTKVISTKEAVEDVKEAKIIKEK